VANTSESLTDNLQIIEINRAVDEIIKENVSRIFARNYNEDNYSTEEFTEVWNSITSNYLPYPILDKFTNAVYSNYLDFFKKHLDFAKKYISLHYPLTYQFVTENWTYLEPGTAHYCVFIRDVDMAYPSTFGICFNKNIRWNCKLKSRYDYGFSNPYEGYVDGTGIGPVDYDEAVYLDEITPLNKVKEIDSRNDAIISHWASVIMPSLSKQERKNSEPDTIDIKEIFKDLLYKSFTEFKEIFEVNRLKVLLNESIWDNTLSYIIDENFCDEIINEIKKTSI
jgi:hypothetical protein